MTKIDNDPIARWARDCKAEDIEPTATRLAENDWKGITGNIVLDDLYETVAVIKNTGGIRAEMQIRPYWTNVFFNLRDSYIEYINYIREEGEQGPLQIFYNDKSGKEEIS